MAYNNKIIKRDQRQNPVPQVFNTEIDDYQALEGKDGAQYVAFKGAQEVKLSGSSLKEAKTNTDAVSGTLTFTENLNYVEIFNTDLANTGVFNVNGLNIHIPPNTPWDGLVGGTPRNTVTVTGSTSYIVNRFG